MNSPIQVDDHWNCGVCGCSWPTETQAENCDGDHDKIIKQTIKVLCKEEVMEKICHKIYQYSQHLITPAVFVSMLLESQELIALGVTPEEWREYLTRNKIM